jgi:tRNA acetyltransferase TAN1
MLADFNLVVSTSRGNERNACSELWYLLGEVGDRASKTETTGIIGLIVAKTNLNPVESVHKLRSLLKERPWEFRYTLKVTPIERVVDASVDKIKEAGIELAQRIGKDEKFRITVGKRHTKLSSRALIEEIAKGIERVVDLDDPDRIVLIEVVAESAGISLLRSDDVLSVEREKRKL